MAASKSQVPSHPEQRRQLPPLGHPGAVPASPVGLAWYSMLGSYRLFRQMAQVSVQMAHDHMACTADPAAQQHSTASSVLGSPGSADEKEKKSRRARRATGDSPPLHSTS